MISTLQGTICGANVNHDRHQVNKGGLEHEDGRTLLGQTVTFLGITEPILFEKLNFLR